MKKSDRIFFIFLGALFVFPAAFMMLGLEVAFPQFVIIVCALGYLLYEKLT